jgi:hypothetical protein
MKSILGRLGGLAAVGVLAACSAGPGGSAPAPVPALAAPSGTLRITPADAAAAVSVSAFTYHAMPLRTRPRVKSDDLIYPADVIDYGGPRMKSERSIDIFVNCAAGNQSCWGAPIAFQTALAGSSFAGLLRQYTGSNPQSYTYERSVNVSFPVFNGNVSQNDLLTIVHSAATTYAQHGYKTLYHVFLPKGTDTCFDATADCYSPGRYATFSFCAYHAAAVYKDIGVTIYSVEPYQDVDGCSTKRSAGASELTNSTISTLAHETFESISDPGPRLAWFNYQFGEIADICEYFVSQVSLGKTVYNTQPMYSNRYHACATIP